MGGGRGGEERMEVAARGEGDVRGDGAGEGERISGGLQLEMAAAEVVVRSGEGESWAVGHREVEALHWRSAVHGGASGRAEEPGVGYWWLRPAESYG